MMTRAQPLYIVTLACVVALAGCATGRPGVDDQRAAETNASLGADFLRKEDNAKAQMRFRRALDYDSDNITANWGMAIVSQRLDRLERARRYYEKALDLDPSGPIQNSYAAFLCQQGDVDRALTYFKRAASDRQFGGRANALANAGLCAQRAQRTRTARQFYRDALAADGAQPMALVRMARLEYDRADYLRARAFIERADAVTKLDAEQLRLGARIELALNDRRAAQHYLERHNASRPGSALALSQLEQSR